METEAAGINRTEREENKAPRLHIDIVTAALPEMSKDR